LTEQHELQQEVGRNPVLDAAIDERIDTFSARTQAESENFEAAALALVGPEDVSSVHNLNPNPLPFKQNAAAALVDDTGSGSQDRKPPAKKPPNHY
jgi:hypothetical protein